MLLLEDRRFYVYVYLDPRKPGNFNYDVNGEIVHFDFEPFYVGKGCGRRLYVHMNKYKKKNKGEHPFYDKLRKLNSLNLSPVIYKISEFLTQKESLCLEGLLIFLIKLKEDGGTLTNRTYETLLPGDHYRSQSSLDKRRKTIENNPNIEKERVLKFKQTMKDNPDIEKKKTEKRLATEKGTDIRKNASIKAANTKKQNPEIEEIRKNKFLETLRSNPDIMKNAMIKREVTLKEDPTIKIKCLEKRMATLEKHPEIRKEAGRKSSATKLRKSKEEKETTKLKRLKTLENNPEIQINAISKRKQFYKDHPEINDARIEKYKEAYRIKRLVKQECIEIIEKYDLTVTMPSLHKNLSYWLEFKDSLNTNIV